MERLEENISGDERRVAELIGTLRHVDAPPDFNARVRSRIADRRGKRSTFGWMPVLAGGLTVAVIALGLYFAFRSNVTVATPTDVAVSNSAPAAGGTPAAPSTAVPAATQPAEVVASAKPNANLQPAARSNKNGGGSVDEALTEGNKFFPRGVDPRAANVSDTRGVGGNAAISIANILSGLGINASWNGSGWQVNSLSKDSLPERSGLKAGDVIESIDGRPLTQDTSVNGSFTASSLRVKRDGGSVDIRFSPR